jgi:nucleotide-binding universal stress UspA family protein
MTTAPTEPAVRVVVGVDGSPESRQALRWASQFAAATGAHLVTVAAWEYPPTAGWAAWPAEWDPAAISRTELVKSVHEVFGTDPPKDIELIVRQGNPAAVLLKESKGAAMLVVGSRGHGGFTGMLLGSVSANVAEHADCPVLVMHGDAVAVGVS